MFSDRHKNVYLALPDGKTPRGTEPDLLVTRIALDSNILPVPIVDSNIPDLGAYFNSLPSFGVLYATRNGRHLPYRLKDLKRDWTRMFAKNSLYLTLARTRYRTTRQALLEFHGSAERNNRLVSQLCQKIYGRRTAYTEECISRIFLGAAIVKKWSLFFKGLPSLPSTSGKI